MNADYYRKEAQAVTKKTKVDFAFQLTVDEADALRFQFGTLKRGQHFKYRIKRRV